jgi:hypothetical protein
MTFQRRVLLTTVCVAALAVPARAAESELSRYRGVSLGESVATVVAALKAPPSDVKVMRERPSLIQELTWRPLRFVSGMMTDADPLAEMVLTFHSDRLVRISATYDRERIAGLTEADLQEALAAVYGPSSLMSKSSWTNPQNLMDRKTIGSWENAGTLLLLWQDRYPDRSGLTISAIAADAVMQLAIAEGRRVEAAEAPARELALRAANAAALLAREEKIRLANKAAFKP